MDFDKLPAELKAQIEETMKENPELVAKFGNPMDKDDPRMWTPSRREEEGLSIEDRLHYLSLDMEMAQTAIARLIGLLEEMAVREKVRELKEEMKTDPEGVARKLMALVEGKNTGDFGPNGEHGAAYAGSVKGLAPDFIVETVDGPIRADQIPGYKNEPGWNPSPDWAEANCTCPTHVAMREQANQKPDGDDNFPTGFYL